MGNFNNNFNGLKVIILYIYAIYKLCKYLFLKWDLAIYLIPQKDWLYFDLNILE